MTKKKIVFDVDDTLWGLNHVVCTKNGIQEEKCNTFHVNDNKLLSKEENMMLQEGYKNPKMFEDIQWYPGIEKINVLQELGADVYINSNCANKAIQELKMEQLKSILRIPEQNMKLTLINIGEHKDKRIGQDVYAFVDDNLYNIADSFAFINLMLEKPWNQNPGEIEIVSGKNILKYKTLNDIMEYLIGNVNC